MKEPLIDCYQSKMTLGNAEKNRNKKARETDRQRQMQTDDRTKERERDRQTQTETNKEKHTERQTIQSNFLSIEVSGLTPTLK